MISNYSCTLGMVEHCNRSIEDVIKKTMITQQDWAPMLLSVLFAIRTSRHSSTGFTPFRMLYNKDPIMPFQHADKLKHVVSDDDEYDSDVTEVYKPGSSGSGTSSSRGTSGSGGVTSSSQSDSDGSDDIVSTIQNLEDQHKKYLIEHTNQLKRLRYIKLRVIIIGKPRVNPLR